MNEALNRKAWLEVLHWHREVGLEEAISEMPRNRFQEAKQPPQPSWRPFAPQPLDTPEKAKPTTKGAGNAIDGHSALATRQNTEPAPRRETDIALISARSQAQNLARGASSLEELRSALQGFDGCDLKRAARSLVFADGNPQARVMLIGEAPGAEEDRQGLPFVGRSGKLLDAMLAAIGLNRDSVYITNILPWRPHGNRNPSTSEIELLRPFVERHVQLAKPEMLLLVGGVAAKALLQTGIGILKLRGNWAQCHIGEGIFPALPTFHPAYLLRRPQHKALAWRDFLSLKRRLDAGAKLESEARPQSGETGEGRGGEKSVEGSAGENVGARAEE